ncbi:hypothetical protein [Cellulomonas wangsupingiae]|uniref:hypothetical protein n=1 Tax=Cellulomonas wangsupingiae TaxID=2968085 RepID=UPI001D0E2B96|nr:hypothetical protein [Cellulomonas wangsupingiae]MCC2335422.1 hypothetical protein [Cellulomonas wangsupingiae]
MPSHQAVPRRARPTAALAELVRRGGTQAGLLAAVLAVVVAGAVLLGTCSLLLTTGQEQALDAALRRADPQDVAVEVTFRLDGADPGVVDDARRGGPPPRAPRRPPPPRSRPAPPPPPRPPPPPPAGCSPTRSHPCGPPRRCG